MLRPGRVMGVLAAASAALLALALPASAQTIIYENNFNGTAPNPNPPLTGWTVSGAAGGVGWAADGNPAPPGFAPGSGPNSLNYNDGVDYDNGATNTGTAMSPAHVLTTTINPQLQFLCAFDTDLFNPTPNAVDIRSIQITNSTGATVLATIQYITLQGPPPVGGTTQPCLAALAWHSHTVDLNPYVAQGSIRIRFSFNTVNATFNQFKGWFIDDYKIVHSGGGGGGGGGGVPSGQGPFVGAPTGDGGSPNDSGRTLSEKGVCATVTLDGRSRGALPSALAFAVNVLLGASLFGRRRPRLAPAGSQVDSRIQRR